METAEQSAKSLTWRPSSAFVFDFEQILHIILVFLMFTLNKLMPAQMMTSKNFDSDIMTLIHNVM